MKYFTLYHIFYKLPIRGVCNSWNTRVLYTLYKYLLLIQDLWKKVSVIAEAWRNVSKTKFYFEALNESDLTESRFANGVCCRRDAGVSPGDKHCKFLPITLFDYGHYRKHAAICLIDQSRTIRTILKIIALILIIVIVLSVYYSRYAGQFRQFLIADRSRFSWKRRRGARFWLHETWFIKPVWNRWPDFYFA